MSVGWTPVVTMLRTMEMAPGSSVPANTRARSAVMLSKVAVPSLSCTFIHRSPSMMSLPPLPSMRSLPAPPRMMLPSSNGAVTMAPNPATRFTPATVSRWPTRSAATRLSPRRVSLNCQPESPSTRS